jgi:uncharacterized SAM-binding protein YcdF (DUF218 family)
MGRRRSRFWAVARVVISYVALFSILVLLLATPRLFLWPPSNRPVKSDAVVALGGDPGQHRAKMAIKLAKEGYAPVAVISLGGEKAVPCPGPVPGIQIICFRADPLDTMGEAEFVGGLVAKMHWHRIIVVPERTQTTRARVLFKRCTPIQLVMVPIADPKNDVPFAVVYEWGALLKALILKPSC